MKKIYTLIFTLVSILICGQIPTSGLIGSWQFSGNATDASGSGNNGTVVGATLTYDRCGNPNSAYSFNGTSNYIVMSAVGPTGSTARSVSFWAKTTNNTINAPRASFSYGSVGAGSTYQIVWNNCGLGVGMDVGTQSLIKGNVCLLNNVWHHIAVVFNPAVSMVYGNISFYIDGVLQPGIVCSTTGTTSIVNTGGASAITIGRSSTSATRYFQGDLDDYYLYNRAITSAEVLQLYASCPRPVFGNTVVCLGTTNIYTVTPITNGTYTWTLPGGWTGTSSTNTISAVVNGAGTISVAASSTCGAFGTSTLAVSTVTLPVLNVSTSNTLTCPGATVALTGSGANTYTWLPGSATTTIVTVSPGTTSNYTLTGRNTTTGCSNRVVFTQSVTLSSLSVASTGSLPCVGSTATLTATGGNNFTWTPGPITGSQVTVSPPTTRIYTVSGITTLGCPANTTISLLVPPAITINISASSASTCPGSSVVLTGTTTGGIPAYTYSWTGGGPPTPSYAPIQSAGGTYTYTLMSFDANNCPATKTTSVFFYNAIAFNSPTVSVCPGGTATLTVSGAATYTWQPPNFVGSSYTLNPTVNTSFTIAATSVNGCTATTGNTVYIRPTPVLPLTTSSINCVNPGSATVTASGGVGPYSYTWSPTVQTGSVGSNFAAGTYTLIVFDNGTSCTKTTTTFFAPVMPLAGTVSATSSLTCNGVNTGTAEIALTGTASVQSYSWASFSGVQTTSVAGGLGAAIHTVTVMNPVTLCVLTQTFLITQPLPLVLNIFPSTTQTCVSANIILSAINSGGTGPHTYTWNGGPTNSFYSTTQAIGGIYTYSATSKDINSCPGAATISLSFVNYPTLSFNNTVVCMGSPVTLSVSGANSYSWYPGGFITNTMNVSPLSNSTYTIIGSTFGCASTAITSVTVFSLPVPTISSNNNICEGLPLTLSAGGGVNYSWTGPNSFTATGQTVVRSPVNLASIGVYTVKVTDNNGCSAKTSTLVTILPNPIVSVLGASVCLGEAAQLLATGGVSYLWAGPAGFSSSNANAYVPVVNNNNTGAYTVFATGTNSCVSTRTVDLTGYPYPLPTPSITATNKACLNMPLTLNGSGGDTYLWAGPGNLSSVSPTLNFTPTNLNLGGIYTLTVKNTSNCAASTTLMVTVYKLPQATFKSSHNRLCVPFCSTFSMNALSSNIAPVKGFYFTNANGVFSDSTVKLCFSTGENKVYNINYVDTNNCVNTATLMMISYPRPIANFEFFPPSPRITDQVELINISQSTADNQWFWYFESNSIGSQQKSPTHIFHVADNYPVVLVVKNSYGCADTAIRVVRVEEDITLYVPSAFSPNRDGLNDTFQPVCSGVAKYNILVFDQWGAEIYKSADPLQPWEGLYKGEACRPDVYFWQITLTGINGNEKTSRGTVTLLR